MKLFIVILLSSVVLCACTTLDICEQTKNFPSFTWDTKDSIVCNFKITDTTAYYNFYFIIRHQEKYPYNNIWLSVTITDPDTTYQSQPEIVLAKNAKWLGTTVDDITDQRILFEPKPRKLHKGNYQFVVKHVMRENPLPHVLSAGVRVQKVEQ